jgi:hypothetical protein
MSDYRACGQLAAFALSVVGACALAAPQTTRPVAPADACALLTQSEVSDALGVKVGEGRRPVADDPRMCNWREEGKPEGPARNVLVTLIGSKEFSTPQAPEAGIGDEAYFTKSGRFPYRLLVRKGGNYFQIMARSAATAVNGRTEGSDDQDKTVDKTLALAILKKI